jgi:iron complex outermembrane receptor protein
MRRNLRQRGHAWLVAIAVVFFTVGAGAQDAGPAAMDASPIVKSGDPPPADPGDRFYDDFGEYDVAVASAAGNPHAGIETISVTAQKRSQTLQEVPVAVSAITGAQLDAAGITHVQDVQTVVPNMHFGQERGEAKITIRGVSNAHRTDPSTAVHVDGIYQNRARPITSLAFFDIQRVEVLRGPQGTLYGRNATGGAMNIISTPPGPEFEAFGDVQLGNYQQKLVRGAVNAPIVEDLAALRVSGFWEDREGYQENLALGGSGKDADDADDFGIRSQLLLTPGGSLDMTLRFNYAQKRGVGFALKQDGPLPDDIDFPKIGPQDIYCLNLPPEICDSATQNPEDERQVYLDTKGRIDNEMINGNADMQWQVPEMPFFGNTKLRMLGSFTAFDDLSVNDQDYSDLEITVANEWWQGDEWVGEIDWSSDYGGDGGWLLGFFHLGSTIDNKIDAPSTIPLTPEFPPPFRIEIPILFFQEFESSAYSVAGFVSGWYRITDELRIEFGARYSHDWKKSHLESPAIYANPLPFLLFQAVDDQRSGDWGEPTVSISLDYQITDDSLAYGRFATGYKAGTVNNDIARLGGEDGDPDCYPPPDGIFDPDAPNCDGLVSPANAEPERLYALEAGLKNTLLDNRGQLNATGFIYWYEDLQVSQFLENQYFVENAATARIWGIELESTWRPIDPLTLQAQFAYLDTTYTDYEDCIDAKDPDLEEQDCTGNQLSRAPRFSGNLTATYEIDFGRFGSLTPLAQVYASDEAFFRPTNDAADTQDAYCLLNFRLMWRSVDDHLGLDLFVDNALDEDVATTKIVGSSLLGAPQLDAYDRPRTFGGRVSLAW